MADYWRQSALVDVDQLRFPITVIGAGGIGSPVTLALAKLGCSAITLYDPDVVEPHNLPNQLFGPDDIGRPKVLALASMIDKLAGTRPTAHHREAPLERYRGLVVCAVDTMVARTRIWFDAIRYEPAVSLLIDARMGGEVGRILAVDPSDPDDVTQYEATLHTDEEASADPCAEQSVGYSTLVIAGLVASSVRRFAVGEKVPFETIVDLATLTLLSRTTGGTFRG